MVVSLGDGVGVEGVGADDIGTGVEVGGVDGVDDIGLGEGEEVVIALERVGPSGEALATVAIFIELIGLDEATHGAIKS